MPFTAWKHEERNRHRDRQMYLLNSAAAGRKDKKVDKYSNLSDMYHFMPVGIETYGAYGPQGLN